MKKPRPSHERRGSKKLACPGRLFRHHTRHDCLLESLAELEIAGIVE